MAADFKRTFNSYDLFGFYFNARCTEQFVGVCMFRHSKYYFTVKHSSCTSLWCIIPFFLQCSNSQIENRMRILEAQESELLVRSHAANFIIFEFNSQHHPFVVIVLRLCAGAIASFIYLGLFFASWFYNKIK